ncbi:hypothetical protein [Paenibacillus riograndensis]|uniref:hypothetical protein n=1 Tax=Paenibacillus riograndensis TaxID=483937 RepID=UPI001E577A2B|nr:hypothetical protein [Paenibacillus riograndensis]
MLRAQRQHQVQAISHCYNAGWLFLSDSTKGRMQTGNNGRNAFVEALKAGMFLLMETIQCKKKRILKAG